MSNSSSFNNKLLFVLIILYHIAQNLFNYLKIKSYNVHSIDLHIYLMIFTKCNKSNKLIRFIQTRIMLLAMFL